MTLSNSLVSLYAHLSRRRRWQLAGLVVLTLVGAMAEMATLGAVIPFLALLADPGMSIKYPMLETAFGFLGAGQASAMLSAGILFSVIAVGAALIRMLVSWSSLRFSFGLGADIGSEVYRRTLYQSYSWHVSRNSSEVLAGIDMVNEVVSVIAQLIQGTVALIMSVGILGMLLIIDAPTALIAGTGFSVLYATVTMVLRSQLARNSNVLSLSVSQRVQAIQEGIGGIRDVLLDGTQPIYMRRFAAFDYAMRRAQASNSLIGASPRYIIEAAGMVMIVALAYWLSLRQGGLSSAIPVLGALAIGAQKLLPQMQTIYASWSSLGGSQYQLQNVMELLHQPVAPEYPQPKGLVTKKADSLLNTPIISLKNVSFRYKAETPEVLHNINLPISKGSRIGFIGKTGSGKSTLIDIILGLLEPTAGQIEIDGHPLTASNRRAWQLRIAHVPQSIYLSDASIAENIAFSVPVSDIDIDRVKISAAKAQIAEFIDHLPQQYQTFVGERGVRLSGGQRQRIGLARALYKQADVLILDEATSALDNVTEKMIMKTIQSLNSELTILIIAHRISTLCDCDQIVEINRGEIKTTSFENVVKL